MKTSQPVWQLVANLGDADPLNYGGLFVYTDRTNTYAPECVRLERITGDEVTGKAERWQAHRFTLEACTFRDGILSDNRFHPELAAWFARSDARRPQDESRLSNLASFTGQSEAELIALFTSNDPCDRAHAWRAVGDFHGFDNLDSYPVTLTRKDVFNLYRAECFPRSVRRNAGKRASRALIPSGESGPFAIPFI